MERKDYMQKKKETFDDLTSLQSTGNSDSDSDIFTDEESANIDLGGFFSTKFSNIKLLYRSTHGATEIHSAIRYGKRFVLKGLREEFRDDPVYNMCMAKEFEIGITLEHPNIRRTIGLERVEGLGERIVLEYIDGQTLADVISSGRLTPERAMDIAVQIAEALKYLHGKKICHRDLKPENILVPFQGERVKIIDFNLSDRDDYIVLKDPAGSKRYMAPELSRPGVAPTPETDYYSLGVIMSELAEAGGSRQLTKAAKLCTDPDPEKRFGGLGMILPESRERNTSSPAGSILSSRILTYILSAISLILMIYITIHYINT